MPERLSDSQAQRGYRVFASSLSRPMNNNRARRGKRAWLAVLFGWCVMFNAVVCCVHNSHAVAASLANASIASASIESCVDHGDGMSGMAAETQDHGGANLAASLGCPLCSSAGGIALSSYWTPELVSVEQPFSPSVALAVPLATTERSPSAASPTSRSGRSCWPAGPPGAPS